MHYIESNTHGIEFRYEYYPVIVTESVLPTSYGTLKIRTEVRKNFGNQNCV